MHGRLSIDQAKAVKQKRELAQELGMTPCFVVTFVAIDYLFRGCASVCEICEG